MARQIFEIRVEKKGDGVVVSGVTRSDRGTKYIAKSITLDYKGLNKKQRSDKMLAAIEELVAQPALL